MKKTYLIFLLLVFSGTSLLSQISKTHYIPPIAYSGIGSSVPQQQYIYLSTPSINPVKYTIQEIGGSVVRQDEIDNSNPYRYDVPGTGDTQLAVNKNVVGRVITNRGYLITADCPIYVSVRYYASTYQAGAFTSKGAAGLGTHFRTAMYPNGDAFNAERANDFLSYISITATENNTKIKATLPNANAGSVILVNGGDAGYSGPIEIDLDANESYIIGAESSTSNPASNRFALFGALIESIDASSGSQDPSKPIVVNVGSANGKIGTSGGRDQGVDQLVPVQRVGHEYIFVRGNGDNSIENAIVVADIDGTEVYLNDDTVSTQTLNAGDYMIISGNNYSGSIDGASMYVRTQGDTHPLFAYQIIGGDGSSQANTGLIFVPPLSEEAQDDINNIAFIDEVGGKVDSGGVSIVYKDGATLEIFQNTSDVFDYSAITQRDVIGKPGYKTLNIPDLIGNVSVLSDNELYVSYYNKTGFATSGGYYAGFATPPAAAISLDLESLGACVEFDPVSGDYKFNGNGFQMNNPSFFDEWEWQEKDGLNWITADGSALNDLNYVPVKSGKYRLRGIISCLGAAGEIYSSVIPVSICPTDFDEDGISDNIDLDLDNDGILNSIESLGDVSFDVSDLSNPIVSNSGTALSTTMNTDIKSEINGTADTTVNSITGLNTGDFETTIPPVSGNAKISYEINSLSENLNLKITAQALSHSIVSGEYFEIEVTDPNKNITLLDPNNQLLVDKNSDEKTFDELKDVNEIKQYTAPLIRFKFNPSVTSTPDFEFLAFNVDGIKLTHFVEDNTSNGSFKGNISAFDYFLDTDSDTIPDYFDLDSDEDGCYDVIEAGFEDADADGIFGVGVPTYPDSEVDSRGLVIGQDYTILPNDDGSGNYYFQEAGQEVSITDQPTNQAACIGKNAEFKVTGDHPSGVIYYQWQFLDATTGIWNNLDGTNTKITGWDSDKLEISDVDNTLAGEYRVQLKTNEYQCTTDSNSGVSLTVNTPPAPPIVEPIQTFCYTDNPTVGNLIIAPPPVNPTGLVISVYDNFDPTDPTVGTLLDAADPLIDGTTYFIEVKDSNGCVGSSRAETKALLSNPEILSSKPESCPGDVITLNANGVPQTALDFELANLGSLDKLTEHTDDSGRFSTYFVDPIAKTYTQAENAIPLYGVGASMYQINDLNEHNAVWQAILDDGIEGTPFWLGLKQIPALNPNNEVYEGWYWLDGRILDSSWNLWATNEPNDYKCNTCPIVEDGDEDYGHFNLNTAQGKFLNDYPENISSRPLYEFSGTTTVKWYYQLADDPANPGNRGPKTSIPGNLTEIDVNPDVTTFYILEVTTNGVVCETEYKHVVNPLPVPTAVDNLELCDEIELTDPASTNTDGISYSFDLDSQTPLIVDGQVDRDGNPFTVTYHKTLTDAQDITKTGLSSPYTNVLNPAGSLYDPQTIYVRLTDEATGCHDSSLTFDIVVNPTPESNVVTMPEVCDDFASPGGDIDGSSKFDLTVLDDDILGAAQVAAGGFEVTYYYENASGTKVLIPDPTAHYNTPDSSFDRDNPTVQTEEIFVRVTDTNASTSCYREDISFTLTVNPLPVILEPVWKVEQCDDPLFDLTDYEDKLSTYPSTETFAYSYIDASGNKVSISAADAADYTSIATSIDPEIIDVEITKNTGGCSRTAQIELKVSYNKVPANYAQTFIAANKVDLFKTDGQTITDTDLSGQSQDGKEEFDTSIFQKIIDELKELNPVEFDITGIEFEFYGSERDARLKNNPIDLTKAIYVNETEYLDVATGTISTSNYNPAKNRWEQEIWINITNNNLVLKVEECVGLDHVTTLYVEKRPVIYDVLDTTGTKPNDVLLLCDEQLTLDIYSEFDTSTLENLLIGNNSDPATEPYQDTSNYIFEYTYDDDNGNPVTTATLDPKINLTNQPITLTLTNPIGETAPFVSKSSVDFMVFETPSPFSGIVLEDCDDFASPGGEYDGKTIFAININDFKENLFKDPSLTGSSPVQDFNNFEYVFTLYDKTGSVISTGLPADELPTTITAETGDYIIIDLTNPISAGYGLICENQVRVDFKVNPRPSFDIDEETVVCLNPLPDNPIKIGTYNWGGPTSLASDYEYSWSRTDLNGIDDTSFSETTETIEIDKGGIYTVSVSDPRFSSFGNGCPIIKTITVTESIIASIDLDNDGEVLDSEYDHFIEIIDLTNDNTNSIKINNIPDLGIGDYEFSLDNFNYTSEPNTDSSFTNLEPGVYSLYIRDKNSYYYYEFGCGILEIPVSVIGYKKYFTPNNDGVNETWKILGIRSDYNADSKVYIFDRYGKLLKQLDPLTEGWDGTYLGKPMPATDYWFRVYLSEDGREFKGHFSLIRGKY
ncbi:T9SS type B sorting domain-containing protein [Flavobacteriaceae bacterium]|nr:T9SS type B sorting domain-containing protein [Flavobacteriaceae bacterium]